MVDIIAGFIEVSPRYGGELVNDLVESCLGLVPGRHLGT